MENLYPAIVEVPDMAAVAAGCFGGSNMAAAMSAATGRRRRRRQRTLGCGIYWVAIVGLVAHSFQLNPKALVPGNQLNPNIWLPKGILSWKAQKIKYLTEKAIN